MRLFLLAALCASVYAQTPRPRPTKTAALVRVSLPRIADQGMVYILSPGRGWVPEVSFTDSTWRTLNTNPIILGYRGDPEIWVVSGRFYKIVVLDRTGLKTIWSADSVAFRKGIGE